MEPNMENTQPVPEYPVNLTIDYPQQSSRLLALASILFLFPKMLLLIPHLIVLWALGIIAFFAWILGQFAVLFTGRYPKSFFDFLAGVLRWSIRVNAYIYGLTDKYPPFKME